MDYLKIWVSFLEVIDPLNDGERGRLFTAMLEYAKTGTTPEFKGNERFIWPMAKQTIDRARAESDRLTVNGSKGGRPRKNQQKPNETNKNQEEPTETQKDKEKKNKEKESKETDLTVGKEKAADAAGAPFVDFWAAYPRKQARENAWKAWAKLRPDGDLFRTIMLALERQKRTADWIKEGGRYVPLAASWLNGKRWEDEAGAAGPPGKTVSAQQYGQRAYTEAELLAVSDDLISEARAARR